MTNQNRAAEIMRDAYNSPHLSPMHHCEILAKALADAGLLMPDFPAPEEVEEGKPYWYSGTYGISVGQLAPGGRQNVMFWDSEPGGVTYDSVEGARELAYTLLAAAKHAEEVPMEPREFVEKHTYGLPSWVYDHPDVCTNPWRMGGIPCVRGTRIPVDILLDWIADCPEDDIREFYPSITSEVIDRLATAAKLAEEQE